MTLCCEVINQSQDIKFTDVASLMLSAASLIIAVYAFWTSKVSSENQIMNSILTNLTLHTNSVDNYVMDLFAAGQMLNGELHINVNHWSFIFTPIIKSKELYEMYKKEYASVLTPKQFDLILKTFYIQIPQLVKIRINRDNLANELNAIPDANIRDIMVRQFADSKAFLRLAENASH